MKTTIIMNNEERKQIQLENNIKRPKDLKAYFACFLECEPHQVELILEEAQKAVHRQIDFSFWFQGMTNDPELKGLKEKIANTVRDYFSEQGSSFLSVVELKKDKREV